VPASRFLRHTLAIAPQNRILPMSINVASKGFS
jgi:hypothetical protein